MSNILSDGRAAFPLSPAGAEPNKADIQKFVTTVHNEVAGLSAGQKTATLAYATRDDLYGNSTAAAGVKAEVFSDSSPGRNGVYSSNGSGSGGARWSKIADLAVTALATSVSAIEGQIAANNAALAGKAGLTDNPSFPNGMRIPQRPFRDRTSQGASTLHLDNELAPLRRSVIFSMVGERYTTNSPSSTVIALATDENSVFHAMKSNLSFRCPSTGSNEGPVTLVINGTTALPLRNSLNGHLRPFDLLPGAQYVAMSDGATARLVPGQIHSDGLGGVERAMGDSKFRPGENPLLFTTTLSGQPEVVASTRVFEYRDDTDGRVVRMPNAMSLATVSLFRIEPNRYYKLRWVYRRRVDTLDPNNDAVRLGVIWLNQFGIQVGSGIYADVSDVTVGLGRQEKTCVISKIVSSRVNLNPPANAVYYRPFIQTYGGTTDCETMEVRDITDFSWGIAPNIGALESRVAAIESLGAGDRLTALETTLDAPDMQTYPTFAAAQAATPLASTKVVRTLGYYDAGDGGGATYKLVSALTTGNLAYVQTADFRLWEHADECIGIRQVGAKIDGSTEDNVPVNAWLKSANILRKKATAFAAGVVLLHQLTVSALANDVVVECGPSITFKQKLVTAVADAKIMLSLMSGVNTVGDRPKLIWRGGHLNNADSAFGSQSIDPWDYAPGASSAGGALRVDRFREFHAEYVSVQGGSHYYDANGLYIDQSVVGGDQGFAITNCQHITIDNCYFAGQPDAGLYPRSNNPLEEAGVMKVTNCYFYRCQIGIRAKFTGGRLQAVNNNFFDCRRGILAVGDYNGSPEGPTTPYHPFETTIEGNRFEKMSFFAMDLERVQGGSIQGNVLIDWGRRLDGEIDLFDQGRDYVSAFRVRGCRNIALVGNTASLREWDGAEKLEVFLFERDLEDAGGATWQDENITCALNVASGRPYDYDALTGTGAPRAGTDGVGIGVFARVGTQATNNTIRFLFNECPADEILKQKYLFNGGTQIIVESPPGVSSSDGSPFNGDMLKAWSGGLLGLMDALLSFDPPRRVSITGDSGSTSGTAVPVRLVITDTSDGSGHDIVNPVAALGFGSGDVSGAGAGVQARIGLVHETTNGGADKLVVQTCTDINALTTRMEIESSGEIKFPDIATTASAANAVLDNGASNQLLRSTSSLAYKREVEDMDPARARAIVAALQAKWYRSTSPHDPEEWSWDGFIAEELDLIDPRYVHYRRELITEPVEVQATDENEAPLFDEAGDPIMVTRNVPVVDEDGAPTYGPLIPDGVAYDRLCVPLTVVVKEQDAAIATLTAALEALTTRVAALEGSE